MPLNVHDRGAALDLQKLRLFAVGERGFHILLSRDELYTHLSEPPVYRAVPDVIIQQCAAQLVAQSRLLYRKRHSVGKAQAADEYIILPKAYAKVAGNDMIRLLDTGVEQPGAGNFPAALHILREAVTCISGCTSFAPVTNVPLP